MSPSSRRGTLNVQVWLNHQLSGVSIYFVSVLWFQSCLLVCSIPFSYLPFLPEVKVLQRFHTGLCFCVWLQLWSHDSLNDIFWASCFVFLHNLVKWTFGSFVRLSRSSFTTFPCRFMNTNLKYWITTRFHKLASPFPSAFPSFFLFSFLISFSFHLFFGKLLFTKCL